MALKHSLFIAGFFLFCTILHSEVQYCTCTWLATWNQSEIWPHKYGAQGNRGWIYLPTLLVAYRTFSLRRTQTMMKLVVSSTSSWTMIAMIHCYLFGRPWHACQISKSVNGIAEDIALRTNIIVGTATFPSARKEWRGVGQFIWGGRLSKL